MRSGGAWREAGGSATDFQLSPFGCHTVYLANFTELGHRNCERETVRAKSGSSVLDGFCVEIIGVGFRGKNLDPGQFCTGRKSAIPLVVIP